jgi:Flp pilus assembly protein TadD
MPRDEQHWQAVEEATELLLEGRLEDGLKMLRDLVRREPSNPYAYHFIGTALFELRQLEPARDAYRAAIKLAPGYLAARVALSHVLRLLGDIDGALEQATEALELFPRDGAALHAAGLAHAAKGQRGPARTRLEEEPIEFD